jgi:hypothetical protein
MRTRHVLALFATLAALGWARPASARVDLGLGADWIQGGTGEFNLTLGFDTWLARRITVGGRAGAAFFGSSSSIGVPVDARLRVHVQRVYFEGLVGPWFIFDSGDLFHFHGAFGFGLESRNVEFGLELGVLGDSTMLGLRLAFPI